MKLSTLLRTAALMCAVAFAGLAMPAAASPTYKPAPAHPVCEKYNPPSQFLGYTPGVTYAWLYWDTNIQGYEQVWCNYTHPDPVAFWPAYPAGPPILKWVPAAQYYLNLAVLQEQRTPRQPLSVEAGQLIVNTYDPYPLRFPPRW